MALPASASVELYLSADGTPIDAGATTLAAQGIGDGAELDAVVSYPPKVSSTLPTYEGEKCGHHWVV